MINILAYSIAFDKCEVAGVLTCILHVSVLILIFYLNYLKTLVNQANARCEATQIKLKAVKAKTAEAQQASITEMGNIEAAQSRIGDRYHQDLYKSLRLQRTLQVMQDDKMQLVNEFYDLNKQLELGLEVMEKQESKVAEMTLKLNEWQLRTSTFIEIQDAAKVESDKIRKAMEVCVRKEEKVTLEEKNQSLSAVLETSEARAQELPKSPPRKSQGTSRNCQLKTTSRTCQLESMSRTCQLQTKSHARRSGTKLRARQSETELLEQRSDLKQAIPHRNQGLGNFKSSVDESKRGEET